MGRPSSDDISALVAEVLDGGRPRAVARLISLIEDRSPQAREISAALASTAGRAHVVGITGSPGVGKSTSTSALVGALRAAGRTVGVLAVDPSSPFTGGALLGDRIRMQEHATDSGVYIRSMASRGHLGGLSASAPQALRVFDAAGCDVVLVETVGVGQSEVEIAGIADTSLVLLAPGMGDGIQAAKAGILEIGDIFVVNKSDRDGATTTRRELRSVIAMAERPEGAWTPPIVMTVATKSEGVAEVVDQIEAHRAHLNQSGELQRRRLARVRREIEALALSVVQDRFASSSDGIDLGVLSEQVLAGATDPYSAADELIALIG